MNNSLKNDLARDIQELQERLTPVQSSAAALLADGNSLAETARQTEVERNTIYAWSTIAEFAGLVRLLQRENFIDYRVRLQKIKNLSLEIIQNTLENGESKVTIEVAWRVLRGLAIPDYPPEMLRASSLREIAEVQKNEEEYKKYQWIMSDASEMVED